MRPTLQNVIGIGVTDRMLPMNLMSFCRALATAGKWVRRLVRWLRRVFRSAQLCRQKASAQAIARGRAHALRFLSDPADADDAVAQALIRMESLSYSPQRPEAYFSRAVRNAALDILRQQ